jgi:hypothetical protein
MSTSHASVDFRIIRNMNILKLAAALAMVVVSVWWNSNVAEAATLQVRIYSSLEPGSGLYEYGKHFDEGNVAFGARDWNFTTDGDSTHVYLRLNLYQTQTYYLRYHIYNSPGSSCSMTAKLAQYIGGQWIDIGGTELHFDHQTQTGETWTNYVLYSGEAIGWDLGDEELCGTSEYHSHQSGDVGTTALMSFTSFSSDTCWTPSEYSFQCPGDYPDHTSCPDTYSGTASTSGVITGEYTCARWNVRYRSTSDPVFYVYY